MGGLIAAGIMASANLGRADEFEEKEKELEKIERKIEEERKRLGTDLEREQSLLGELGAIEKICVAAEEELSKTNIEIKLLRGMVQQREAEIREIEGSLAKTRRAMNHLLVSAYKVGPLGGLKFVWASQSLREADRGFYLFRRLAREGKKTIERFEELEHRNRQRHRELNSELEKVAMVEREMVKEKARAERSRNEKIDLIARIQNTKELRKQMISDLERTARSLEEMLERLRSRTELGAERGSRGLSMRKGNLPYPARGVVMRGFGIVEDPEFHTILFRKGIEIEADPGESVIAVEAGEVIYSGWFEGYGNMIIIDHGDGYYTLSARLRNVLKRVGDVVEAKEMIGQVAGSGMWGEGGLYFEIRRYGQPLDPEEWLTPGAWGSTDARDGPDD